MCKPSRRRDMGTLWVALALAQVLSSLGETVVQQPGQQLLRQLNQQLGHQLPQLSDQQPSQQSFYLPTQRRSQEMSPVSNQRPRLQSIRLSTQQSSQQSFYQSNQQPSPQSAHPPNQPRPPPPSPDPFRLPGRGNLRRQRGVIDLWLLPCGGQCMTRASGMCRTDYACLSRLSLPWPTERK